MNSVGKGDGNTHAVSEIQASLKRGKYWLGSGGGRATGRTLTQQAIDRQAKQRRPQCIGRVCHLGGDAAHYPYCPANEVVVGFLQMSDQFLNSPEITLRDSVGNGDGDHGNLGRPVKHMRRAIRLLLFVNSECKLFPM